MTPRLYKEAEVCAATGLQPYVLRSWEKEFPGIGVQKSQDTPRLYRESDVEQVRRIKQLVFGEGLTLAGARRRLEQASPRRADADTSEIAEVLDTLGADARSRIDLVRTGLRSLLAVLSKRAGSSPIPELPRNGSSRDARSAASGARKSAARSQKVRRASASNRSGRSSSRPKSAKRVATAKRGAAAQKRGSSKRKTQRF